MCQYPSSFPLPSLYFCIYIYISICICVLATNKENLSVCLEGKFCIYIYIYNERWNNDGHERETRMYKIADDLQFNNKAIHYDTTQRIIDIKSIQFNRSMTTIEFISPPPSPPLSHLFLAPSVYCTAESDGEARNEVFFFSFFLLFSENVRQIVIYRLVKRLL